MPTKSRSTRASQKIRRSVHGRKIRSRKGRPRRTPTQTAPAVIADSIHSLTLKPKGGGEVYFKTDRHSRFTIDSDDRPEDIYADLFKCCQRGLHLLKRKDIDLIDVYEKGLSLGTSIDYVLRKMEQYIVPSGFEYNIEKDHNGEFHLEIYTYCEKEWGDGYWHHFQIKPVVNHLKATYPKLHDLFLVFLNQFIISTDVDPWWGYTMDYCHEMIEEEILNFQEQIDDPALALSGEDKSDEAIYYKCNVEARDEYSGGQASTYKRLITGSKRMKPQMILKKLRQLRKPHPMKGVIESGCALLGSKHDISHFTYDPNYDSDNGNPGLKFEMQSGIIWDKDDAFTQKQEDVLEAEGNEGVYPPIYSIQLTPTSKELDFEKAKDAKKWLHHLENFINHTFNTVKKYERKNTNPNH